MDNETAAKMVKAAEKMIEKFQCPGCVCGSDLKCGRFKMNIDFGANCDSHVVGTNSTVAGHIVLGMPKGFNRTRRNGEKNPLTGTESKFRVRFWTKGTEPGWDKFNVAVWAMEKDGYLFVRTYSPRIDDTFVDVVEGGKLSQVPQAINVGEFHGEID